MLTPAGAPAAGPAPPLAPAPPPGTPCGRGRGAAIARGESEEREERGGECNFTPAQLGAPACPPPASAEAGFWVSEGGREEKRKAGGEERREAAGGGLGCVYIEPWGGGGGEAPGRMVPFVRSSPPAWSDCGHADQPTESRPEPGRGRRVSDCD
jgi:hypothetical protein